MRGLLRSVLLIGGAIGLILPVTPVQMAPLTVTCTNLALLSTGDTLLAMDSPNHVVWQTQLGGVSAYPPQWRVVPLDSGLVVHTLHDGLTLVEIDPATGATRTLWQTPDPVRFALINLSLEHHTFVYYDYSRRDEVVWVGNWDAGSVQAIGPYASELGDSLPSLDAPYAVIPIWQGGQWDVGVVNMRTGQFAVVLASPNAAEWVTVTPDWQAALINTSPDRATPRYVRVNIDGTDPNALTLPITPLYALDWSPDGRWLLLSTGLNSTAPIDYALEWATGKVEALRLGGTLLGWLDDGATLLYTVPVGEGGAASLWRYDLNTAATERYPASVHQAADWLPQSRRLIWHAGDSLWRYDLATNSLRQLPMSGGYLYTAPCEDAYIMSAGDGTVYWGDLNTGAALVRLNGDYGWRGWVVLALPDSVLQ